MTATHVQADCIGEPDGLDDKIGKELALQHVSAGRHDCEADRIPARMLGQVTSQATRHAGSAHRTETVASGLRDLSRHAEADQRNKRQRVRPSATTTIDSTGFTADPGNALRMRDAKEAAGVGESTRYAATVVASFAAGYGLGAAYEHVFGLYSLAVPVGLLLAAVALDLFANAPQPRS